MRERPGLKQHGGVGLLPGGGTDVFFWSDESHTGRSRGAGRPGIHQRVLSVCVGAAAVSGDRRIHRHGYIPPHSPDLLQLPAVEATACEGKRVKEEEKKMITRSVYWSCGAEETVCSNRLLKKINVCVADSTCSHTSVFQLQM